MKIDAYSILILLSVTVVASYIFNWTSARLKIPSVLLLIASGIGLQFAAQYFTIEVPATGTTLELLGIAGLIFIVLEASLDLTITKEKIPLIGKAFLSALVLLGLTAGIMAVVFMKYFDTSFEQAILHAVPLSIISSAIAIPSAQSLDESKKEFIIYESTFSDILGIVAFNYFITEHRSGAGALLDFGWDFVLVGIIAIGSSGLLIFLLERSTSNVKFYLAFAILTLVYSLAKSLHLPSLIVVLVFGLVLNNFNLFSHEVFRRVFSYAKMEDMKKEMKVMTAETAFVIRTFFFLLFGFTINLTLLASSQVILMGTIILVLSLGLRFVFVKFFLNLPSSLTWMAPRGLITILLFYSIPENLRLEQLSEGVLFIVIGFTGIFMTIGLLLHKKDPREKIEDLI